MKTMKTKTENNSSVRSDFRKSRMTKMTDFMILMKKKYHQSITKSLQQQDSSKT